jgi:hypothetical protein
VLKMLPEVSGRSEVAVSGRLSGVEEVHDEGVRNVGGKDGKQGRSGGWRAGQNLAAAIRSKRNREVGEAVAKEIELIGKGS